MTSGTLAEFKMSGPQPEYMNWKEPPPELSEGMGGAAAVEAALPWFAGKLDRK
jgi:hypothetical protein